VQWKVGVSRIGLVVGALALVLSGTTTAHAHGDSGLMSIDARSVGVSTPDGAPGELTVQVRITYAGDGDPAAGAVATATATEAGGTAAAPVALVDMGDGTYTGSMLLPTLGSWTVRVESANPAASAEQTVDVIAASTTTSTSTMSSTVARAKEPTASTTSDDTSTEVLVAAAAAVVAIGLSVWLIARRRRSGGSSSGS
jgi:hypothetical protein